MWKVDMHLSRSKYQSIAFDGLIFKRMLIDLYYEKKV